MIFASAHARARFAIPAAGLALAATTALAAPALAARSAAPSGTITVYAALTTQGGAGFASAFEAADPGVKVNMVTAGTGALESEIDAQQQSGHVQPDVVLFADPSSMGALNQIHVLSNWRPDMGTRNPPAGYIGNGWVGAFTFENVIVYGSGVADPPRKWTDLTSPALRGQVAIGSASYSGTTFGWAAVLSAKYGWKYFEALKANGARVEQSTTTTGTDVATGRDEAAVTLDSVARSLLAQGANIHLVWPEDGAVPCPAPVGVTSSSQNPTAAKAFVDWLVSRAGQAEAARLGYDAAYYGAKPAEPLPAHEKQLFANWNAIGKQKNDVLNEFAGIFG